MSPIRLHKWVFSALTRLYPGRYFSRQLPVIRPKRRPVTLDIDQFDRRESPTSIVAVDPVTAHLVSFAAMQEPLPPVVQVAQSSDQHAISTRTETSAPSPSSRFFWDRTGSSVLGDNGASSTARSPLSTRAYGDAHSPLSTRFGGGAPGQRDGGEGGSSSWWRSEVYGDGAAAGQARDVSLLSTLSGEQFKPNLEAVPNPQAPFVDPLADFVPLKNKPILSADPSPLSPGGSAPGHRDGGEGAPSSAAGSGSSATGADTGQSSFIDSAPPSNPFAGLAGNANAPGANATRLATPVANASGLGHTGSDVASNNGPLTTNDYSSLITHNSSLPNPDHSPSAPHHRPKDPFWVLDANKAIVVTPGTTENEFSNTAMDLRMQVSGATVSSYSWDLTGAPDTTGVSGSSTYNLTFSWSSWTTGNKTETIVAKETPQGGSQVTQTLHQLARLEHPANNLWQLGQPAAARRFNRHARRPMLRLLRLPRPDGRRLAVRPQLGRLQPWRAVVASDVRFHRCQHAAHLHHPLPH